MKKLFADVVVAGGGPAGAFAAVKAAERGAKVLLVDKGYVGKSGCGTFGAGSFKAYLEGEDELPLWYGKAVEEGCFLNDQKWLRQHFDTIGDRVRDLESYGVVFERHADGSYNRIEGQGSSRQRPIKTLMFHGPQFMEMMRKACLARGVTIVDHVMVCALLHEKGNAKAVRGCLGFHGVTGELYQFGAKAVVLTAGAQAYKSHYADLHMVTGDAHIMALEAGAALANYEFGCHQLTHSTFATHGMNISQGLGARFVNALGEDFTAKYDPEYASHGNLWRISAAMALEVHAGRGPLYLDYTSLTPENWDLFSRTLPLMYRSYEQAGYVANKKALPGKGKLEWVSALIGNVGFGGGIYIDIKGRGTLEGLYAAGDAAYGATSGVEGFCAYAMPAASTTGAIAGNNAAEYALGSGEIRLDQDEADSAAWKLTAPLRRSSGVSAAHVVLAVQEALFPYQVYILRDQAHLESALKGVREAQEQADLLRADDSHGLRMAVEARNMARCAEAMLKPALLRTESRGSHIRLDYPETDNEGWLKWILVEQREGELALSTKDVPIADYPLKPERGRELHASIAAARKLEVI